MLTYGKRNPNLNGVEYKRLLMQPVDNTHKKFKMSTYTQILYQIVFSTKNRELSLVKEGREKLFRYIWGILKNNKCHFYRINGVEDHIHILTSLHPSIALSDLVKDVKIASSKFIKSSFSKFRILAKWLWCVYLFV